MNTALEQIEKAARRAHLAVFGALHEGEDTIILLGPHEPGFWAHVEAEPEFHDGARDPLDRFSRRVITALARELIGTAVFPSDGPPYPPFIAWALASGRAWASPVGMLVHDTAGLFVSYRGALRLSGKVALPSQSANPCLECAKPCINACPVDALGAAAYDVAACRAHVRATDTAACRSIGCAARRICPLSQRYARLPEQSAFHMRAFLGE
ncbi:ferredoxin [Planktotalea arctica]|uniref:ferredoxin n=1 Tax=Planktotalea arctica TaxID=1481893 RepID=UPI00321A02C7